MIRPEGSVLYQVVDRSNSNFYIAFSAVEVLIFMSVLGLHVNLIQMRSKPFFCDTVLRKKLLQEEL